LILAELEKQYGGSAKKAAAEAGLGTSWNNCRILGIETFGAVIAEGIKPLVDI
jgi:hypothetical protein